MTRRDSRRVQAVRLATLIALGTGAFAALAGPSSADVTAVTGSALGMRASVSLFGGPANPAGPTATVSLPSGGSPEPLTATEPQSGAIYGPATIFSSGPVTVSTEGSLGPAGSVTSSADLQGVNASGEEVFTADRLQSTCTATEEGASGSTTVTNGNIILHDPNPDTTGEPGEEVVTLPTDPAPNTTYEGVVANVEDNFRAVFNEQTTNPDGSLTVTAYHLYLLGPTAVGEVVVGQVVCGVAGTGVTTTTNPTDGTTTTTIGPGTTTTTIGPGTTTTRPATTTTTGPRTTTTTVVGVTTTRPAGGGGRPPGGSGGPLVRTGSAPESLVLLGALSLVLGALVLVGLRSRAAPAGGPWAVLGRQVTAWRRERRPWRRRRWF